MMASPIWQQPVNRLASNEGREKPLTVAEKNGKKKKSKSINNQVPTTKNIEQLTKIIQGKAFSKDYSR